MFLPKREDAIHKVQLYRLLTKILDSEIARFVYFKGGTCAAMMDKLDRFSIDLDFDLDKKASQKEVDQILRNIFQDLDLKVDKKSKKTFYYVLKYKSILGFRNSIKLSFTPIEFKNNVYNPFYLKEIDRFANCQTVETMFGNKLVALKDRYNKRKIIAGRDLYDIHYFFINGYRYNEKIIEERTGKPIKKYFIELINFIEKKITEKIITEDLSYLLSNEKLRTIKDKLKKETILLLKDEIKRVF